MIYPAKKPPARKPKERKQPKKTGVPRVNRARKAKRFEIDFGGKDYVSWITSLACDCCGVVGFSDPAHLTSRGAGGHASDLAPLCRTRPSFRYAGNLIIGCHWKYDTRRWELPEGTEARLRENAAKRYAEFQLTRPTPEPNR